MCPQLCARDCRRLANAHPNWDGVPPPKKNDENLKFGLKFSVCAPITSLLVGIFSPNFSRPRDELWSTKETVIARILIHPNCSYTVSWSRKSIRHVILFGVIRQLPFLQEEFRLPKLTFHSYLRRRAASRRALPRTSSFKFYWCFFYLRSLLYTDRSKPFTHSMGLAVYLSQRSSCV